MKRPGWTRLSDPKDYSCFAHWRYEPNGYELRHCGHPTANFPYYLIRPDGQCIYAPNGRGFQHLRTAMEAAEKF